MLMVKDMIKISNRLCICSSMVRRGKRLCDVGTDHGYVPVYLVENGIIPSAVACDINDGPLASCKALVEKYSLSDKIKCVLSDGLDSIDGSEIDDILLAGMGGELIADILSRCSYVKDKHLIMNPMTHPEVLRKWLYSNGFTINRDVIVPDGRHHYNVFDAVYTGAVCDKTEADYYLGNITDFSDREYFMHLLSYLKNKQKGGEDNSLIIKRIEELI